MNSAWKNGSQLDFRLFRIVYYERPWVWKFKATVYLTYEDDHKERGRVFGPLIVCWRTR
jgi:hypothetical protein